MAGRRLSMRKIKEILRLKWQNGCSDAQIADSCKIARSTVREYLRRAQEAGLTWPLEPDLDDRHLENLLFPVREAGWNHRCKIEPKPPFKMKPTERAGKLGRLGA